MKELKLSKTESKMIRNAKLSGKGCSVFFGKIEFNAVKKLKEKGLVEITAHGTNGRAWLGSKLVTGSFNLV